MLAKFGVETSEKMPARPGGGERTIFVNVCLTWFEVYSCKRVCKYKCMHKGVSKFISGRGNVFEFLVCSVFDHLC